MAVAKKTASSAGDSKIPGLNGYNTTVTLVTPEMAIAWLEFTQGPKGCRQRPISTGKLQALIDSIEAGEWHITHQGIAIDEHGCVLDGQHRLTAIKLTNKPQYISVSTGVPSEYFKDVDTGKTRNPADIAAIVTGESEFSAVRAAAARVLAVHDSGLAWDRWSRARLTAAQLQAAVAEYQFDQEHLHYMKKVAKGALMTHTSVAIGWYMAHRAWPEGPHDDFLEKLGTQSGMPDMNDPRKVLFNNLKNTMTAKKARPSQVVQAAYYLKAWNAVNTKRTMETMSFRSTESWPVPFVPKPE